MKQDNIAQEWLKEIAIYLIWGMAVYAVPLVIYWTFIA